MIPHEEEEGGRCAIPAKEAGELKRIILEEGKHKGEILYSFAKDRNIDISVSEPGYHRAMYAA